MAFDPNSLRKSSGNLELVNVVERVRLVAKTGKSYMERWALVRCQCNKEFEILLSRWRSIPPSNCQRCAIKNSKKSGWHGFRTRKTVQKIAVIE